jgi:hypothetical protein
VLVALPSYSVDRSVYEHYGDRVGPLEHRFLYALLSARRPGSRVIFLSSRPIRPEIVDGYLGLVSPQAQSDIRGNSLLLSPDDASRRPLAEKALAAPGLTDRAREFIGPDVALIEAWNVTESERDLALALGAPINGTDPARRKLATKSAGRKLFRDAGVPTPAGMEDLTSPDDVADAIGALRRQNPRLAGVVVKLDDSVAGDGNIVLRFDQGHADDAGLRELVVRTLPEWYVESLAGGGVVEELIVGEGFCSPSGQGDLRPDGLVEVLATHDQRLGGPDGQIYEGCTFPARDGYAAAIADHVATVGRALLSAGARGRFAVDFAATRKDGRWSLFALEINLRKGGTTHPYGVTRIVTGGHYEPERSRFVCPDGSGRCYAATDNLLDEDWKDRDPDEVRRRLVAAGVDFDCESAIGVIPHLLDCLPIDGRMGYTAIGRSWREVAALERRIEAALRN